MKIIRCKTNHIENPLGFSLGNPVLSWCVADARGKAQTAARVVVSENEDLSAPVSDSGFRADISGLGFRPGLKLAPRTRYYWAVTVRSDAGEEASSAVNWFETAKLGEPWSAGWITCGGAETRHPVFEKEIPVSGEVRRARLYLCGLGLFEASLNGEKIGNEFLAPGCCDYNAWVQYHTCDITEGLRRGGRLAVSLGNGWYKGRFGWSGAMNGTYGDSWKLIAEVRVDYADGRSEVFGTDESWQVRRSCTVFSNIYDGEQVDLTLPELPAVPASPCEAPKGKLTARLSLPVRVQKELPVTLLHTPAGETVLDFGQNIAGIFRFRVSVPKGREVLVQICETLQDGNFYRGNLRSAKEEYRFVSDGREHVLQPRFTFYGGRYAKVEGVPELKAEDFTALAISSDLEETGRLTTGNELVNRLISNVEWSRRDNFVDVPTDCPQRDERMGWTGDAQVFSPTACYLTDSFAFYRKYLYDMAAEQASDGGRVPNVIPNFLSGGVSPVWGDAGTIIPWNVYQFSGDKTVLEDQFVSMKSWVDYMTRTDGGDFGWRRVFNFGDWLALDVPGAAADNTRGATDEAFIADVYYMNSAELVSQAAEVLGKDKEKEEYAALAVKLRARIKEEFYSPAGRCCIPTQTALLMTLRYGLSDFPARARKDLRNCFRLAGDRLQTGFVGTGMLCNVLTENGMEPLAERLLLSEEYPGWLHEVKLGATTVWERWNSLDENGRISSTGMNSLNHYAYGAVLEWMYRHLAGLQPLEPGFVKTRIAPNPVWELRHLECSCAAAAGEWRVSWKIESTSRLTVAVTVPFGCTAELALPLAGAGTLSDRSNPMFSDVCGGVCRLTAGSYSVTYDTETPVHVIPNTERQSLADLLYPPKSRALVLRALPEENRIHGEQRQMPIRQIADAMGVSSERLDRLDEELAKL